MTDSPPLTAEEEAVWRSDLRDAEDIDPAERPEELTWMFRLRATLDTARAERDTFRDESLAFGPAAARTRVLAAALERTLGNFRRSLAQTPVRDATETIVEAETALATLDATRAKASGEGLRAALERAFGGGVFDYTFTPEQRVLIDALRIALLGTRP